MANAIRSHDLRVERTARYFTLGDPAHAQSVWFLLHGYGQSAEEFLEQLRPLADPDRLLVAPEALSRFYLRGTSQRVGASWMTRVEREAEIGDYVGYLDRVRAGLGVGPGVDARVLGFSQGAATAARWAVAGAQPLRRLVLCCGGVPPDFDATAARAALADTRVSLLVGDVDPHYAPDAAARDAERLARLADLDPAPHVHVFSGAHVVDVEAARRELGG